MSPCASACMLRKGRPAIRGDPFVRLIERSHGLWLAFEHGAANGGALVADEMRYMPAKYSDYA